jgi:hypothetical protein
MKRMILTFLSILLGAFIMLAPLFVMLYAVLSVESIESIVWRPLAILGLLLLGVVLFIGTTYISTHLVVRFFRHKPSSPPAA